MEIGGTGPDLLFVDRIVKKIEEFFFKKECFWTLSIQYTNLDRCSPLIFKGNVPIQPLNFFILTTTFFKKKYVTKTGMKKVTMIFKFHFSCCWLQHSSLSQYGGRHSCGGGDHAEAPRSVITIDWFIIFRRFYERFRG
jgi:hypothetical protein